MVNTLGSPTLFGMQIRTSPLMVPVPVLQLRPDFLHCTDEFRAEMNAYLLDMFGTEERCLFIGNDIFMSPRMRTRLEKAFGDVVRTGTGVYNTDFSV